MLARSILDYPKGGGSATITFPNGSAASPSVTFTNDTTTGLFLAGAGILGLSAGGVERLRLSSDGGLFTAGSSYAVRGYRNNSAPTQALAYFHDDHASSTQDVLRIRGDGVQDLITARNDVDTVMFGVSYLGRGRFGSGIATNGLSPNSFGLNTPAVYINGVATLSSSGATLSFASNAAFTTINYGNASVTTHSFLGARVSAIGAILSQASAAGNIPVISLSQADLDKEFVSIIGTSQAANITDALVRNASVGGSTLAAWVKFAITDSSGSLTGSSYYMPLYTLS